MQDHLMAVFHWFSTNFCRTPVCTRYCPSDHVCCCRMCSFKRILFLSFFTGCNDLAFHNLCFTLSTRFTNV